MLSNNTRVIIYLEGEDFYQWGFVRSYNKEQKTYVIELFKPLMSSEKKNTKVFIQKYIKKPDEYEYRYDFMKVKETQICFQSLSNKNSIKQKHLFNEFLYAWKKIWSRMVPMKVDKVLKNDMDIFTYEYHHFDNNEHRFEINYTDDEESVRDDSIKHYRRYVGSSVQDGLSRYIYRNKKICFSSKTYNQIDMTIHCTGVFGVTYVHRKSTIPPKIGDTIMGEVKKGKKGYYFDKWFIASPEFYKLWSLVCGMNILDTDFETRKWYTKATDVSISLNKRKKALKNSVRRYESAYNNWSDIYTALYHFYNGDFDDINRCVIPDNFIGKFVNNIISMYVQQ